ncbi:N-acetylneuraminate lyase [Escherichia coli]|nr:N-acetylneuraminate lyase [Escherichia coli]
MATNLRGVMAALLTPFDQQQALDKASLRRLVQFNIQQGIDGLYVGGSTGEAFVQSLSEREQVLEIVAEEAKGRLNSSPTSVASAPPKANNLRHRLNVMASMPSPPSRRSTIFQL